MHLAGSVSTPYIHHAQSQESKTSKTDLKLRCHYSIKFQLFESAQDVFSSSNTYNMQWISEYQITRNIFKKHISTYWVQRNFVHPSITIHHVTEYACWPKIQHNFNNLKSHVKKVLTKQEVCMRSSEYVQFNAMSIWEKVFKNLWNLISF